MFRVGLGHDTHRTIEGRPLILGGVTIPSDSGLDGHSDADVLLHAINDAILGAAGLGDIGEWFPDTDVVWRDANSADLLASVLARLTELGVSIVNIDGIVFAQRPKLSPYKEPIRSQIATLLGVPLSRVNVKAKTGERVGPIGREEAIAAEVVVLIDLPAAD